MKTLVRVTGAAGGGCGSLLPAALRAPPGEPLPPSLLPAWRFVPHGCSRAHLPALFGQQLVGFCALICFQSAKKNGGGRLEPKAASLNSYGGLVGRKPVTHARTHKAQIIGGGGFCRRQRSPVVSTADTSRVQAAAAQEKRPIKFLSQSHL